MDTKTKLLVSTISLLLMAAAITAAPETSESEDPTTRAVAALKSNLGNSTKVEIDEVRVTANGVACIEYRVDDGKRAHAVVQGEKVLESSGDPKRFEEVWTKHCLGPRGGASGGQ